MLGKRNKRLVQVHPPAMNYQIKKNAETAPGRLIPIHSIADFKIPTETQLKSVGSFRTEMIKLDSKMPFVSKYFLQRKGEVSKNAAGLKKSSKEPDNFIKPDIKCLQTSRANEMQSKARCVNYFKSHSLDEKEEESTEEDMLKRKMMVVANWIIDCERAMKKEKRKHELVDLKCPWWMKTAMERRCIRIKRANRNRHGLIENIPQRSRELQDEKESTQLRKPSGNSYESVMGRYLDASGSEVIGSDRPSPAEKRMSISELFADEVRATGANVAKLLDNGVYITWCFEYDKRDGNKMYQNVKPKNNNV